MKVRNRHTVLVLGALASAVLLLGCAMKVCLFSAVRGVVTNNGVPVANAEVERSSDWGWKNKQRVEKVRTDAQGRFAFDATWDASLLLHIIPAEPNVMQRIFIRHDGKEHRAWLFAKHNYDENGELGVPLEMTCELTAQEDLSSPRQYTGIAQVARAPNTRTAP